jgi:hypothetical protein
MVCIPDRLNPTLRKYLHESESEVACSDAGIAHRAVALAIDPQLA